MCAPEVNNESKYRWVARGGEKGSGTRDREGRGEALRRGRGGEEVVGKGRVGIGGSKTRRKRGLGARGAGGRGERVRRQ